MVKKNREWQTLIPYKVKYVLIGCQKFPPQERERFMLTMVLISTAILNLGPEILIQQAQG